MLFAEQRLALEIHTQRRIPTGYPEEHVAEPMVPMGPTSIPVIQGDGTSMVGEAGYVIHSRRIRAGLQRKVALADKTKM